VARAKAKKIYGYILDNEHHMIHDRSCSEFNMRPVKDFSEVSEYNSKYWQCKHCAVMAYIHYGAKDRHKEQAYSDLFNRFRLNVGEVRFLYVILRAITELNGDELIIHRGEDTWKLVPIKGTRNVTLYHNNYTVRNGRRFFGADFHVQSPRLENVSARDALTYIKEYSWSDNHTKAKGSHQKDHKEKKQTPLWQRVVSFFEGILPRKEEHEEESKSVADQDQTGDGNYHFTVDDFHLAENREFPEDGLRCIYLWKGFDSSIHWDVGVYSKSERKFFMEYRSGVDKRITPQNRVIAWKSVNEVDIQYNGESVFHGSDNRMDM
jgi:hypothetical protein